MLMLSPIHPSHFRRCLRLVGALAGIVISGLLLPAKAAAQSPEEVRAIFLYNFAKFVEWPPATFNDTTTPITISVVGNNAVAKALDYYVRGKNANGRDLTVKKLATAAGCAGSQIVFVGDAKLIPDVIAEIAGKSILSVADADDFLKAGGAIRLFEKDGKVQCAINIKVTDAAGLKLSEKLVKASS